jgi:hypothetical protein
MKPFPLLILAVGFALSAAHAQVGADVVKNAQNNDITSGLLGEEVWTNGQLPGQWVDTSTASEAKGKELSSLGQVFGILPQQVQAWLQDGKVTRMNIVFLEAGNFFGFRKSKEANYTNKEGQTRKEEREANKKLEELKKEEDKVIAAKRGEFAKLFDQYEKQLLAALEKFTGKPGVKVTVGQTWALRTRALEFATPQVRMRLTAEDGQIISLAVIPATAVTKSTRLATVSGSQRRADAKDRIKTLPDGDVLLDAIPMINQGSRGYCAIGTLAMIGKYYGLEVDIDQLASKAGYKEGDTSNASIIPIYEATAKEGRMRMKEERDFDFREVIREIDKGHPILVWRYFSRERDEFHHQFAADHLKNPTKTLPDPKKDKGEKALWPSASNGGHASLITGYNKARNEVLFTESWGEGNRHRRMLAEEMAASAYVMFFFEP